ncbi:MAG: helix-turn-helix domain-containing protein [bacterium]|nr:helix-turn-helix domain-containing protein [bacterium]
MSHKSRLAICALLGRHEMLSFSRFKELLEETDGNLGAQLRKLEDAGFIAMRKAFEKRKPITWYSLTALGREKLNGHLQAIRSLIDDD